MHLALMPMAVSPHLELIHGGRARTWRREGLEVVAAAPGRPPFSVERTVVEEDRWRVVGASPEWRPPPPEHPVRLHTSLVFEHAAEPGRILRQARRWHAVVVDVDAERLVDPAVVVRALAGIAALCDREAVRALALPLLGAVHGDLPPGEALSLLHDGLLAEPPASLRRVWLQVPLRHRVLAEQALAGWSRAIG
ncbi:MAG: hypothetical protein GWP66_06925 [Gammaproteobacteria bacterium]|nr:hypothetical protein [Gammaproteobacteria bacterium]